MNDAAKLRWMEFRVAVRLSSYSELARRLKVPLSTVHGWHRRRFVPPWRGPDLATVCDLLWQEDRQWR
jgi:DNA-binding transcriptional regulator YiaG